MHDDPSFLNARPLVFGGFSYVPWYDGLRKLSRRIVALVVE